MPTIKRSMASYWNGSAWVDIVVPSTTDSALINFDMEDTIAVPTMASLRIANRSNDPTDAASNQLNGALDNSQLDVDVDSGPAFVAGEIIRVDDEHMLIDSISSNELTVKRGYRNSTAATHLDDAPVYGSATAKGPYTDVFTDFIPIKVRDGDSEAILFYGTAYSIKELYDMSYGMVIEVQCRDYLTELRDNSTDGAYGYKIDDSADIDDYVLNNATRDDDKKVWNTLVSSRSGIIKSLLTQFSKNVTAAGDTDRFIESANKFGENDTYKLGGRNQKSILAHILELAASEPYTVSNPTEEVFGYDFYVDPNFTLTTAAHKPTSAFNYFKRGQRPNTSSDPLNYGLRIEHPSSANFTPTGKLLPMLEFDFERPRGEIYTDAIVKYTAVSETEDGGTSAEERIVPFEIITIKAAANLGTDGSYVPRWKGLPIATGHTAYGENDAGTPTIFPEWLEVEISGTWTTIARMQYINKTSGIDGTNPAYVLISEVNPALSDTDAHFAEGAVWRAKDNTSTTFTLLSRPRTKYGVRRTLKLAQASGSKPSAIREQIAASLMRRSTQIIRGSFKTYNKPQFYFDNALLGASIGMPTSMSLGNNVNPLQQGFRVGMTIVKLDPDGDVLTTFYGYATEVTSTNVIANFNAGQPHQYTTMRFFVPVRAGDLVYLRNNLINIAGNYLVTKIKYTEQPGISNTTYEVVGRETNKEGGYNRKAFAVATSEAVNTNLNIPQGKPNAGRISDSIAGLDFTSSLANQVAWGTGTYDSNAYPSNGTLTIGIDRYTITLGTTASTMVSPADGNTDQIDNQLNEALDNSETAVDVDSGSVFAVNDTIRIDDEHMLITAISTNTLTVTRGYFSSTAATHLDNAPVYTTTLNSNEDYYIYYSGSGTALSTIRKANFKNVADEDTLLIGHCKADTHEAEFTIFVQQFSIPDKGSAAKKISPYSLTNVLTKKGAQPWTTDIKFEGTDWNAIRWYKAQTDDGTAVVGTSTAGSISFADNTTESITAGSITTSDSTFNTGSVNYVYKNVGDSSNAALVVTPDYAQAYRDDRVLLATVVTVASDDGTDSPTILPFNGNVQTISATAIAAQAIVAGNIKAGTITTNEINMGGFGGLTSGGALNLSGGDTSGSLSLDKTTDGSSRKTVDANQESGAGYAYTGLNSSGRIKLDVGTSDGAKFWSYGSAGGDHTALVVLDNIGLVGYSKAGGMGAFPTFDVSGAIKQFEIRADTGEGSFANRKGVLSTSGLVISATSADPFSDAIRINWDGASKLRIYGQNLYSALSSAGPMWFLASTAGSGAVRGAFSPLFHNDNSLGIESHTGITSLAFRGWESLVLAQGNSAYIQVKGASSGSSWTLTLPDSDGGANEFLQTNGSGVTTWAAAPTTGDVTLNGVQTLTNKTLTTPTISSTGFTNAQHAHIGTTTGGALSWTIIDSQVSSNSEGVAMAASVTFTGGGGISTTLSGSGNVTLLIEQASSERYKENIENLTFDTSKIFNLTPRSFTWKATSGNGFQGQNDFGLIAEEVNEIIPELVFNNLDDEIQGIKAATLVTMLLVELKKLKARIEVLEGG